MAGDIFYSEVDKNLRSELNARALAGAVVRDKAALDFSLTKMTNVKLSAFFDPKMTSDKLAKDLSGDAESPFAVLGGATVRKGDFVPTSSPILDGDSITDFAGGYLSSKRKAFKIPPVITLCNINIGDGSMGLLNKATVNILISDPSADLDEFENVWFRPGRHVLIEVEGNQEQLLTRNRSLETEIRKAASEKKSFDEALLAANEVAQTYGLLEPPNDRTFKVFEEKFKNEGNSSEFLSKRINQIRHMNKVLFDGVLTSFTFSYQNDGSIDVTLQFSGTSNVYTDVELMMPTKKKDSDAEKNSKSENTEINTFLKFIKNTVEAEVKAHIKETSKNPAFDLRAPQVFFNSKYGNSGKIKRYANDGEADAAILYGSLYSEKPEVKELPTIPTSTKAKETNEQLRYLQRIQHQHRYIQLGLLIEMLNREILSELERVPVGPDGKPDPEATPVIVNANVVCDKATCRSTLYDKLVSSDPSKILLYGSDTYGGIGNAFAKYPAETHIIEPSDEEVAEAKEAIKNGDKNTKVPEASNPYEPISMMPFVIPSALGNDFADGNVCYPSRIFIEIDTVLKPILEDENVKTANHFLKRIASVIKECTGGAIVLSLITDPVVADQLIFYDRNFIGDKNSVEKVNANPYKIPMGAKSSLSGETNTLSGTIVTDLKLSSKLPADLQNLAFTLNQGTTVSSNAISAFTSFMFAQGKIDQADPPSQKFKIAQSYAKSHKKAVTELEDAKCLLTDDFANYTNQLRLSRAIKQYLKFPTDDILKTNVLTAPIYPFDAELTIEGISGFKYGDVVELPLLPKRYKTQTVFSIIAVDHTIDASGTWTTKLKLIMRPKIT